MDYCSRTDVANYLLTTIDSGFNSTVDGWITAMSRFMDSYTGRTLVSETTSTRKYDGNGTRELLIDEAIDITEVRVGTTTVTPLQYPANSDAKYQLMFESDVFTRGRQNVEVDATFARYNSLPEDIKFACTVLVAGIVNQNKDQNMAVKSEKIGQYQVTYQDEQHRADVKQAMMILDLNKRIAF